VATDSVARRVAQKEVRLFFGSPVAWLFLASFAAVSLFVFFWVESFFARNVADVRPLFEWMPLLLIFLCAALTMRMWSDERRTGTLEHVLTQPVSLWRFVFGKFRACFSLLLLALACTLPLPVTVALVADLDWGPVLAGYLATALLGASYLSLGLFVSARTDNPIVSLIVSVALGGLLYLLGSPLLTGFFNDDSAELLRMLGTGSRFDSITRGVLDLRDLFYYVSLTLAFLTLNVYALEHERWARGRSRRHNSWRLATTLVLANLLCANLWLSPLGKLRVDVTEGSLYSISEPTHALLSDLKEPLLIRGYFSAKTHPLLAPLVPQLKDLLQEYAIAGGNAVRVEFIDPASDPALEQEANEQHGIYSVPFQVADRYQSALVNAYFNVLVSYGGETETLGFADLIEVRTASDGNAEVLLRNPEYDVTRAIRDVLQSYQAGGDLFDGIDGTIELTAYVSNEALLPELLLNYKDAISAELAVIAQEAEGRFRYRFVEPEAGDGEVARHIAEEWGFQPMVAALNDEREFYFYLTLSDARQVVQLPTDSFDASQFRTVFDAGLKRFSRGFTKTVALSVPDVNEQMARFNIGAPTFTNLERMITRDHSIRMEQLSDGEVDPTADILAVVAPQRLDEASLFAMDQFLMRGGTVILSTSPFTAELSGGQLQLQNWDSGLADWLAAHGLVIEPSLVLDTANAPFPLPVTRQVGDYEFRDVRMLDYPYFIDLRHPALNRDHPITASLPQLTMAWASPITADRSRGLRVTNLMRSSPESWRSSELDVMPRSDASGSSSFQPDGRQQSEEIAVVVQGRFESWFRDRDKPTLTTSEEGAGNEVGGVIARSPESARLVLFASNDFMDDQILNALVAAAGTQYLGPLELFMNAVDWSLQDESLLQIRSRGHFNRTLPPMETSAQALLEYINYGLALLWLVVLAALHWLRTTLRRRRFERELAL
jgi:ABC-2 type transport system permease protein